MSDEKARPTQRNVEVSETQLVRMAQQEEAEFNQKQNVIEQVTALLADTINARETLTELKTATETVYVGIGASIMIPVTPQRTAMVKRSFGDNGYKDESIDGTLAWLAHQEEQFTKQLASMRADAAASETRLTELVGIIKQIEGEKRRRAAQQAPLISK